MAVYEALNWTPTGKMAVKLSTGEPPASNYLHPELIKDVVQAVDGTIVECNTAYGGQRSSTAMHYQVAQDHGFTDIADVVILDENGSMSLPVNGGSRLTENLVGQHFADYDSYLVLSHFRGHAMAGYGVAICGEAGFLREDHLPLLHPRGGRLGPQRGRASAAVPRSPRCLRPAYPKRRREIQPGRAGGLAEQYNF